MDDTKHKAALLILAGLKPKGKMSAVDEEGGGDEEGDIHEEGLHSAMQDLLDAVHKSDVEAMAEAFKDAWALVDKDDDGEEQEKSDLTEGEGR